MRAALLAALAVCAAEGTAPSTATTHYVSSYGTVYDGYSTPQEWLIPCLPGSSVSVDILCTQSHFSLTLDGWSLYRGENRATCPSSGNTSLVYTPDDGRNHILEFTWFAGTVHDVSDVLVVDGDYSTPQEWLIYCRPGGTLEMNVRDAPSGYILELDGSPLSKGSYQIFPCPSSGKMSLVYVSHVQWARRLRINWVWSTYVDRAPGSVGVHYMFDSGSVDGEMYVDQHEWIISCAPGSTIWMEVVSVHYRLTLDGRFWPTGHGSVTCPSSGNMSLLYTPKREGKLYHLTVRWYADTHAPPRIPDTRAPPTPSPDTPAPPPATVHSMSDHDSVDSNYSAAQKWVITCTPHSSLSMTVTELAGKLTTDTMYLTEGETTTVPCPTAGEVKLSYVPRSGSSQALRVKWVPDNIHSMSDEDEVYGIFSTGQEWVITCAPHSSVSVTVTQLPGALTVDWVTLAGGQSTVPCPSAGIIRLLYFPSPGSNRALGVKWSPAAGGQESKGISPLLIVLIATVGLLVLVGVTVAVYCGCRGKAADPNAYSSNVQVKGCADADFGGLQDSSSPPAGQQPMNEMEEQLLEDSTPL